MIYNRKIVIADILKGHGLKPGYIGFDCLLAAIDYILENELVFKKIYLTKEIYPEVAALVGSSARSVERNIRSALERAKIYQTNGMFIKAVTLDCYTAITELFKTAR